jgi:DNA-binding MarR family transcriptional regulator
MFRDPRDGPEGRASANDQDAPDEVVAAMDDALVRLRRLWNSPPPRLVVEGDARIELSSVLVVEACFRGSAAGREVSVGDVAQFADVRHSTASRLVDRAIGAGLVRRGVSADDARRVTLELTREGAALRARAVAFRSAWLRQVVAGWPLDDVSRFADLLGRFAAAVARTPPPGPPSGSPGAIP